MTSAIAKNLHVPLPASVYRALREEAARQKRPATQIAREAIIRSLAHERKRRVDGALRDYVAIVAGTADDQPS